ncbi:MAG: hypothetical protein Q9218_002024 [Villophora microphyllina]
MESQMNALAASTPGGQLAPRKQSKRPKCRYFLSPKGCRAGNDCRFVHDSSKLEGNSHSAKSGETSQPTPSNGGTAPEITEGQSSGVGANGTAQGQQTVRRYQAPPVHASRIVQKPIPRLQKEDPRDFQMRQLERRFSAQEIVGDGESTLKFQLVPSDPDFPFELTGLECVLHVPKSYPGDGRPSLAVTNSDMPRGYQINVERGFDSLVQNLPQATLLALINTLDKQLEAFLTHEKAETIKFVPNTTRGQGLQGNVAGKAREAPAESHVVEKPRKQEPQFTLEQRHAAEARRQAETLQLEARLGRLSSFFKSPGGIAFNIPISPGRPGELPVPLQAVQSIKLYVPVLYPLHPCRIEIPGVSRESAGRQTMLI